MSNMLFGHKVQFIVGKKIFSSDDFDIEFDIPFDDGTEPNIASIDIYNLKNSTINDMKKGSKVILNAGYQNDVGAIFIGEIQTRKTDPGIDKKTSTDCMDSGEDWFTKEIKKTYKKGTTGRQILNDLLPKTGLKPAVLKLPTNKVYKSGKTVESKLAEAIADVAKDCGAKVHVTRGKMYIRPKSDGDVIKFVLDKDHGLIGSPTPVEKEEKYTVVEKVKKTKKVRIKGPGRKYKTVTHYENKNVQKSRTRHGWKITSLLNHRITTDAVIQIKSKTVNGTFRVESGRHTSNGFYTEMEVY